MEEESSVSRGMFHTRKFCVPLAFIGNVSLVRADTRPANNSAGPDRVQPEQGVSGSNV